MEIIFHGHHATVSPALRRRAEQAVEAAAARLRRAVSGVLRFENDGPMQRVEIVLYAPRGRTLVAVGEAKTFEAALGDAAERLDAQIRRLKSLRTTRARAAARG